MRAVVIFALTLAVLARPADACRCAGGSAGDFEVSTAVMVAKVVGTAKAADKRDVVLVLEVESAWKGDVKKTTRVVTRRAGSACGRPAMSGRWIVFAQRQGKQLVTHLCDSSREATQQALDEMTKQFGAPKKI